jgi:lipopolysaccharide cholinephosphotransferase
MESTVARLQDHQAALLVLLKEFDRVCRELEIPYMLFAGTMLGAVRHQGFIPWDDDLDVLMARKDYERLLREGDAVLDREKFFLQKEFTEHWPMFFSKLRLNGTTCLEKYHPKDPKIHQGVYMDIFPCDNGFKTELGLKLQFLCSKVVIAKGLYREGYVTDSFKKKVFMQLCRLLPLKPFHRIVRGPEKTGAQVHVFLGGASKYGKSHFPANIFGQATLPFEGNSYFVPKDYDRLLTVLYGDYRTLPPPEERKCKQHAILVDLNNSWEHYEGYRDGMTFDTYSRSIR